MVESPKSQAASWKAKYRRLKKAYDILRETVEVLSSDGSMADEALYEAGCVLNGRGKNER